MKSRVLFILASIFVLFVLGLQFIPYFPMGPYKSYSRMNVEQEENVIPFQRLSSEVSRPFIYPFFGPMPETYIVATNKFKTVADCLISSEQKSAKPDLRLLDWEEFTTPEEINVCIWRIFDSFGNSKAAAAWMEFHGFEIKPRPNLNNERVLLGAYNTKGRAALFPVKGISKILKPYMHGLSTTWSVSTPDNATERLLSVQFSSNYL